MKHHDQWRYERVSGKLSRRADSALGYLLALFIGCGLAATLVYGWSVK